MGQGDRGRDGAHGNAAGDGEHQQVARAHHQHQCLEARAAEPDTETGQRAREPSGPAALACRHVQRRRRGRSGADQEDGCDDPGKTDHAEHAQGPGGRADACAGTGVAASRCVCPVGDRDASQWGRGLHGNHCYVCLGCKCPGCKVPCDHSCARRGLPRVGACLLSPPAGWGVITPLCDAANANAHRAGHPGRVVS